MFGLVQRRGERYRARQASAFVHDADHCSARQNKLFMTAGAPGGSRITTAVVQVILNRIDFGMQCGRTRSISPASIINGSRTGCIWSAAFLRIRVALLKARGYTVDYSPGCRSWPSGRDPQ